MPKSKPSTSCHLKAIVSEYGDDIFSTDGKILFCKMCEIKVAAERKFTVVQHVGREKHIRAVQLASKKNLHNSYCKKQYSRRVINRQIFKKNFCEALVSANIPFWTLNNTKLKSFLELHFGRPIPDESTMRKNYLSQCYDDTISKIRGRVHGKKIFVSIDETNDVEHRYVANVVIGTLEIDGPGEVFLLTSEVLETVNHSTICRLFDKCMFLLWPEGIRYDDVLLFVKDSAPYIVKAGKAIQAFYPKMVHITCIAHGMHRVAEEVRATFSQVDSLVSQTKKIFVKAPSRKQLFKSTAPSVPLPPEPVITRWGTWIDAAIYYCDHFQIVKRVIEILNPDDAAAIASAKKLYSDSEIEGQLAFIKSNFNCLTRGIASIQEKGASLERSLTLIREIESNLKNVGGEVGRRILKKVESVLGKNSGYKTLCDISKVLTGESFDISCIEQELTAGDFVYFKYAPVVSADVERSFSRYKNVLSENRRSLTFDNLRMLVVVYCNNSE